MISLSTYCAVLLATAKQMPCAPMMTAVLMPITSPREDTSGPPELPGLSAASVWITSSIRRPDFARKERPSAEMTPAVTVDSKPSGLPIATTSCPRLSALESPSFAVGRSRTAPARKQRQIGVGILADHARLHDAAFGVGQAQFLRALDHMAVGEHEPIGRDDDAGADAAARFAVAHFHAHHRRADRIGDGGDGVRIGVEQSRRRFRTAR